jgi:hypothetical protein
MRGLGLWSAEKAACELRESAECEQISQVAGRPAGHRQRVIIAAVRSGAIFAVPVRGRASSYPTRKRIGIC